MTPDPRKGDSLIRRTLVSSLVCLLLVAAASPALGAIRLKKIAFDPPGKDTGTNTHLNKEWILIKNTGSASKNLSQWKLKDKGGDHTFGFPGISLPGGDLLKLHTGSGSHDVTAGCGGQCTVHHYYWDLNDYVWNNGGDKATLKKPSGAVADSCGYGGGATSPKRC